MGELAKAKGSPTMVQLAASVCLAIQSWLQLPASLTTSCSLGSLAQNIPGQAQTLSYLTLAASKPSLLQLPEKVQFWCVGLCMKPNSSTSCALWLLPSSDAQVRNRHAMPRRRALAILVPSGM